MSTPPTPPAAVVAAVSSLRSAFADIHVMHDCDQDCAPGCDLTDESEWAYRKHDEHNFDVRERIHEEAEGLVSALAGWLVLPDSDAAQANASGGRAPDAGAEVAEAGSGIAPLVLIRDSEGFEQWWADSADQAEITDHVAGWSDDEDTGEDALHALMLSVFQSESGAPRWLRLDGLAVDAVVQWVNLDIDPSYDGEGVRDGVDVVLNACIVLPGQQPMRWLSVSVSVDRMSRDFTPEQADPRTVLAAIVDQSVALINNEIAERDAFTANARRRCAGEP